MSAARLPISTKRLLRVLFVEFSPSGGLFQFSFQLGEALADRGHDVRLVTGRSPELQPSGTMRIVEALPTWHAGGRTLRSPWRRKTRRLWRACLYVAAWLRLIPLLARGPADAVFISAIRYPVDGWAVVALRASFRRTAIVLVAHEPLPLAEHARGGSLYRSGRMSWRSHRLGYRATDLVLVLGAQARHALLESVPDVRAVGTIPHGGEQALLHGQVLSAEDTPTAVLFFGTWTRSKGMDLLFEAFRLVRRRRPDATLTVAGAPGPSIDEAEVRRWADSCGGVDLRAGYVPVTEVGPLFAACRVVVLPYSRGFQSGVLHLAHTYARPVVATDVGDLASAVGGGGLLVPPGDAEALAAAVLRLLDDPLLAARMGQQGHSRIQDEASWASIAETVELSLVEPNRPTHRGS